MITADPEYVPGSAGEHEAFSLMNEALEAGNCEVMDYPRIVENVQNIPRSITFMVGGVSPTLPKQEVRLRGYVLPDGTLQQVALAHDQNVCVLRRREGEGDDTAFMDRELWTTTVVLLFGPKPKGDK
jgi:hypothetical protein